MAIRDFVLSTVISAVVTFLLAAPAFGQEPEVELQVCTDLLYTVVPMRGITIEGGARCDLPVNTELRFVSESGDGVVYDFAYKVPEPINMVTLRVGLDPSAPIEDPVGAQCPSRGSVTLPVRTRDVLMAAFHLRSVVCEPTF